MGCSTHTMQLFLWLKYINVLKLENNNSIKRRFSTTVGDYIIASICKSPADLCGVMCACVREREDEVYMYMYGSHSSLPMYFSVIKLHVRMAHGSVCAGPTLYIARDHNTTRVLYINIDTILLLWLDTTTTCMQQRRRNAVKRTKILNDSGWSEYEGKAWERG